MKTHIFQALAFIIILHPLTGKGQDIKNLVFEGAGVRGVAYCGAIQELENRGLVPFIEKVGGTSAGAITALCVSLGYSSNEISELLYSTDFSKFSDGRFFFAGGIFRLAHYFGWYRGERFMKWVEQLIEKKTGNAEIDFKELHEKGFKDLYVTATNLKKQQLVILSRYSYPQMKVKDAVRISISIPFYFEALFVTREGKLLKHPKKKGEYDVMVDGGFIGNFPIHIFDSILISGSGEKIIPNKSTLGFRIDSKEQIECDRIQKGLSEMPVSNLKEYGRAFYTMILENLNRQSLSQSDWIRTVSIGDAEVGPRLRRLSRKEMALLIENGRAATHNFFNGNNDTDFHAEILKRP